MNCAALFEIGVGFAGKAHHHVGADGGVGHQGARLADAVGVVPRAILAVHAAQGAVAAALQGRVHVARRCAARRPSGPAGRRRNPSARRNSGAAARLSVSASRRRIRSASRRRLPGSLPQRPRLMPLSTTLAIAPRQAAHLFHHLSGGRAAAAPAHERDDAEGAAIVAAVLNLQIGPGAVAGGIFHRRGKKIAAGRRYRPRGCCRGRGPASELAGSPGRRSGSCANCPPPIRRRAWTASSSGARCA